MKEVRSPIPDFLLEQYRLGELDAAAAAVIKDRLADDAGLQERLAALDQSDRDLLAQYPPEMMAARIDRRLLEKPERPRLGPLPIAGLAAAMAGALALVFFVWVAPGLGPDAGGGSPDTEVVRVKGDATLRAPAMAIYRRNASGAETLKDGAHVFTRDTIQLRYDAADKLFGVILSVDGRGTISAHFPAAASTANALERGGVLLPHSFELDDVPDFERFFFVTANTGFDPAVVQEAVKKLVRSGRPLKTASLDLPEGFSQTSFLLIKEKR
jgi:hypothetical protein